MNVMFYQEKVPSDLMKALIKVLSKKGDNSGCGSYRGNSLVSVGSKLFSMMITLGLEMEIKF